MVSRFSIGCFFVFHEVTSFFRWVPQSCRSIFRLLFPVTSVPTLKLFLKSLEFFSDPISFLLVLFFCLSPGISKAVARTEAFTLTRHDCICGSVFCLAGCSKHAFARSSFKCRFGRLFLAFSPLLHALDRKYVYLLSFTWRWVFVFRLEATRCAGQVLVLPDTGCQATIFIGSIWGRTDNNGAVPVLPREAKIKGSNQS